MTIMSDCPHPERVYPTATRASKLRTSEWSRLNKDKEILEKMVRVYAK